VVGEVKGEVKKTKWMAFHHKPWKKDTTGQRREKSGQGGFLRKGQKLGTPALKGGAVAKSAPSKV